MIFIRRSCCSNAARGVPAAHDEDVRWGGSSYRSTLNSSKARLPPIPGAIPSSTRTGVAGRGFAHRAPRCFGSPEKKPFAGISLCPRNHRSCCPGEDHTPWLLGRVYKSSMLRRSRRMCVFNVGVIVVALIVRLSTGWGPVRTVWKKWSRYNKSPSSILEEWPRAEFNIAPFPFPTRICELQTRLNTAFSWLRSRCSCPGIFLLLGFLKGSLFLFRHNLPFINRGHPEVHPPREYSRVVARRSSPRVG